MKNGDELVDRWHRLKEDAELFNKLSKAVSRLEECREEWYISVHTPRVHKVELFLDNWN